MSELDETLNRRRLRSEASGAVFEVESRGGAADAGWDQPGAELSTPRESTAGPAGTDALLRGSTDGDKSCDGDTTTSSATASPALTPCAPNMSALAIGSEVLFEAPCMLQGGQARDGDILGRQDNGDVPLEAQGRGSTHGTTELARMESPEGLRNRASSAVEPRSSLARLDSPGRAFRDLPSSAGGTAGIVFAKPADEPLVPLVPVDTAAESPLLEPSNVTECAGQEPYAPWERRDSAGSAATMDAGLFATLDTAETAPASPACSPRSPATPGLPPHPPSEQASPERAGPSRGSAASSSGGTWGPTPPTTGVQLAAVPHEKINMSSSSYFRPHARPVTAAVPVSTGIAGLPMDASTHQPFPKAKEAVLHKKLGDASAEVAGLCATLGEFAKRPHAHPAEVQQIIEAAESIQARTRLQDTELELIGWPTKLLQEMREIAAAVGSWQACEQEAKQVLADGTAPLPTAVRAIEGLLAAWQRLSGLRGGLRVDLGLERRARGAGPMISALLDQAMASVRRQPNMLVVRQLEALIRHSVAQPELRQLGVAPALSHTLHELSERQQGMLPDTDIAARMHLAVPDVVWRAVVEGDVQAVASMIHKGGLVSGRMRDSRGHTMLWDAIAFGSIEVALLLLKTFPPDLAHGVDLGELHARNGNSLLHLASGLKPFTSQAEGLFAMLFERMPEAFQIHQNQRRQTFIHIAAARLNFYVLKYAAMRGLGTLFTGPDGAGWTPQALLDYHLSERNIGNELPAVDGCQFRLPPWCSLGALQPPSLGTPPQFSDMVVDVRDKLRGRVELHAHRVILAGCSRTWHRILSGRRSRGPSTMATPAVLSLDPAYCSSADVALFAVRFLYTGNLDCSFKSDSSLLMQLVRLCSSCRLPAPLCVWASNALLRCLDDPGSDLQAGALMAEADNFGLAPAARCFLARRLFASDAAVRAVPERDRDRVIEAALGALEGAPAARAAAEEGSFPPPGAAALGSGILASRPVGSMPLGSARLSERRPSGP